MKEFFVKKQFGPEAMAIVRAVDDIVEKYQSAGYRLSLRQLYYQLVSANIVPNTEQSYGRVGVIVADARLAGLCDWDMIEDRNRETVTPAHWDSPADIIDSAAASYRLDKWATQPDYCEVMVEKQALEGVLEPVCRTLDVPFTANKGYASVTLMYQVGRRFAAKFIERCVALDLLPEEHKHLRPFKAVKRLVDDGLLSSGGITPTQLGKRAMLPEMKMFYLGDHDPSGIDMTRDVEERLRRFSDFCPVMVERLALNMEQVEELQPPENPAKMTDSRAKEYVERFGNSSWELDVVEPAAMADMVRQAILGFRDSGKWAEATAREAREVAMLKGFAKHARRDQESVGAFKPIASSKKKRPTRKRGGK